jgi:isopentenyldiphosphate isomerase/intracellular septation protein A
MKSRKLLLSFLPGFAPILAYILVDALFGEKIGLFAGIALGLGEFFFILVKEKRLDRFTLLDTALLVAMGALSWILRAPVFFKLKPAVSEAVLGCVIVAGALGPHRFFLPYMEKKLGTGEISENMARRMLRMVAGFGALSVFHSALTAVAALFWSKAAWAFVAGALFWLLALAYLAAWTLPAMVMNKLRKTKAAPSEEGKGESLPIVDEEGTVIGKADRPLCHAGQGENGILHPVVRLWLLDESGGFWLQKRATTKLVQPGKWDCAVGGHVSFGESLETALRREAGEEIGLHEIDGLSLVSRFVWRTDLERELVFLFASRAAQASFTVDPAEVSEIRLWKKAEIESELKKPAEERSFTSLAIHELVHVFNCPEK